MGGDELAVFGPGIHSEDIETPLAISASRNLPKLGVTPVLKPGGSRTTSPISKPEWSILPVSKSPDFENGSIWQAPVLKPELPNGPLYY